MLCFVKTKPALGDLNYRSDKVTKTTGVLNEINKLGTD